MLISEAGRHCGEEVSLDCWMFNRRSSGKLAFMQLRDGTGFIQGVVSKKEVPEKVWDNALAATMETSMRVTGTIVEDKRSPFGYEMHVSGVELLHVPPDEYPIAKKEHGVDFLMEQRHLWLRSKKQWAIMRVRDCLIRAIREFFHQEGFVHVDAPILTANAAEGTTTLFATQYFDLGEAYLSQSGQLYMEAAAMALGRVYCFGPTFRAEKSKTRRHLNEFWMIEPEIAFCDLDQDIEYMERFTCFVVRRCLEECQLELGLLERDTEALKKIEGPFPRMRYDEVLERLNKLADERGDDQLRMEHGQDLGQPHEDAITEGLDKPLFITHWPKVCKAFYMKEDPDNPDLVLAVDMISPEKYGELIGGSQREDDFDKLEQRIKDHGLPLEAFAWYLDLRRYGSVTHSGFGLGLERTLQWITGTAHIRETIPYPRTLNRIYP